MMDLSRPLRLAELVASLSLATDLGFGQPQERVLRQTVLAVRPAEAAGLSEADRAAAYYVSLLARVGCVADSPEMARWFGDDPRIRADSDDIDETGLPMMAFLLGHLAEGTPGLRRISVTGRFLAGGVRDTMDSFLTHCRTAADIAERLDLPDAVEAALPQAFERWDGHGVPGGVCGDTIIPVMRVVHIADDAEVHARVGGVDAALRMSRSRSGTEFDTTLGELCIRDDGAPLDGLDPLEQTGTTDRVRTRTGADGSVSDRAGAGTQSAPGRARRTGVDGLRTDGRIRLSARTHRVDAAARRANSRRRANVSRARRAAATPTAPRPRRTSRGPAGRSDRGQAGR